MRKKITRTVLLASGVLLSYFGLISESSAQVVIVTNGTNSSASAPLNNSNPYSANEMIYLQSQINQAGPIYKIAYDKTGGAGTSPITNVNIYMKHTTQTAFTAGAFDTTGYTRVYKGDFTNTATSGWMEITLNTPFVYNNTDNLAIIFFKNNGNTGTGFTYRYGFVGRLATRRVNNATGITAATTLNTSDALANIRLDFTQAVGIAKNIPATEFSVFPNPATDKLNFRAASKFNTLKVLDLTGRLIETRALNKDEAQLNVAHLKAGLYILELHSGESVAVSRFFKE